MILSLVSGFILGIALGSFVPISLGFFLILIFIGVVFYVYQYFLEGQNRLIMTLASVAMLGVLCGVGRMYFSDLYTASHLDKYVGQKISIYAGTGCGQTRGVANYNGTTKVATVARNWTVNPDATSYYRIEFDFGPKVNNALEVTASNAGADLTSIPWNAAWDAEVQSECADALVIYNSPTLAAIEASTVLAKEATVNTRLATAGYTAPDNASIADLKDEALGKWVLDPTAKTLTLYRADGVTVLKAFNLADTQTAVPAFISRTPI